MRAASLTPVLLASLALAGCAGDDSTNDGADASSPSESSTPREGEVDDDAASNTAGDAPSTTDEAEGTSTPTSGIGDDEIPGLDVEVVMDGLALPWDVQLLEDPSGSGTARALVTERGGRLLTLGADGLTREVSLDIPDLFVGSESGLMGLAVGPEEASGRTIFLCHATQEGGAPRDIRVTRWALDDEASAATADGVVVDGLPISSGRHGGCRLLLADDTLYVGTGDAAQSEHPQSLESLGGKVLAVDLEGEPVEGAPFVDGDPRILSYGHRNVQGLAVQAGTDALWSVEHGPDVDDEVNVIEEGGNYGWDPGPGYAESVPMTDTEAFPDAVEAAWSTGDPTHALAGAVFLEGGQWGAWDGALTIAELRGQGVTVLTVDGEDVTAEERMEELEGTYGRLRSLTLDADGALWVTTSNGQDDVVLRVTPQD